MPNCAPTSCYLTLHHFNSKITKFNHFSTSSSSYNFIIANSGPKIRIKIMLNPAARLFSDDDKKQASLHTKRYASNSKETPSFKKVLVSHKKMKSILLLNVICIVYASNIAIIKEIEAAVNPAAFSAVRFAVSAVPFLPFVFKARHNVQMRNTGMELGLWVSLGYLIEALGLTTSDAGRASFISMFTVIVVPLLEGVFGGIIPARTWFAVLMSIIGVGMLECSGSPPSVGDLLNFLSAIFFGIHTIRTEHIARNTKERDFLPLLGYEVCVVAVLSTIWYLLGECSHGIRDAKEICSWTWDMFLAFPWIPALYTGTFSTGLCLWAEIVAMRDVSATETALIYGMEPIWGAGFAWFLLGERWGIVGWIGATLVFGGSMIVQMIGTPRESTMDSEYEEDEFLMVTNNHKYKSGLSQTPLIVSSDKVVIDMVLKKRAQDNLK